MRAMFYRCARVIEHALSAKREYITKDGQILLGWAGSLRPTRCYEALRDFMVIRDSTPKSRSAFADTHPYTA